MRVPRQARKISQSGIYHVIMRGINQQTIFEDDEDYTKFLQILSDCKAISEFKLFAYCLMSNHIHILIKPEIEPLEQIFKRIGSRFVYWYNIKYKRQGHLFQDRFKSESVEDDSYFLTVVRYIHQNPVKAGVCGRVQNYKFSSFSDYINDGELIDREFLYSLIDSEKFEKFNAEENYEKCLDIEEKYRIRVTDEEAKVIIKKLSKCQSVAEFQELDIKLRDNLIKIFIEKGLSIRQISRLTGTSFGIVRKFL